MTSAGTWAGLELGFGNPNSNGQGCVDSIWSMPMFLRNFNWSIPCKIYLRPYLSSRRKLYNFIAWIFLLILAFICCSWHQLLQLMMALQELNWRRKGWIRKIYRLQGLLQGNGGFLMKLIQGMVWEVVLATPNPQEENMFLWRIIWTLSIMEKLVLVLLLRISMWSLTQEALIFGCLHRNVTCWYVYFYFLRF